MKKYILALFAVIIVITGCIFNKQPQSPNAIPPLPPLSKVNKPLVATVILTNSPSITSGLTNLIVYQGSNVPLAVVVSGNSLKYQWRFNGKLITSATNSYYTLTNIQATQGGTYNVFVTNVFGKASSSAVIIIGTTNILTNCLNTASSTLSWCQVTGTNGNIIIGYRIYYGTGNPTNWTSSVYSSTNPCGLPMVVGTNWLRTYSNTNDAGTNLTYTITNLTIGRIYYATCVAYNQTNQDGDMSNEAALIAKGKPLTNAVLRLTSLIGGKVILTSKLCPYSVVSILYLADLNKGWSVLASNQVPDIYGNLFYIETPTTATKFYRLQIQ